ncbi:MAG: DUF5665 domain-containing protein [Patescibacteria group bacterium]
MRAEKIYIEKSKGRLFFDNLIGGIGWGIGTIIGAVLLVSVLGFIAARVQAVPIVGEFVYNVTREVQKLEGK